MNSPRGLAFDSAGNLYVSNAANAGTGNNTIEKFTPGGVGSLFASSGLSTPEGLAFDSAGNLYASNIGNGNPTIEKFNSTGTDLGVFASSGLSAPHFLAFTDDAGVPLRLPVPEPSSWAMLAFGAASLLCFRRRRSAQTKA